MSRSDRPRRAALKQLVLASEWVIVCTEQLFAAGEVVRVFVWRPALCVCVSPCY